MCIKFYKNNISKVLCFFSGIFISGIVFYFLYMFKIIPSSEKNIISNNNSTRQLRALPPILPALDEGVNEYPWKCIPSLNIPVRINQKLDVECMSFNEEICLNTANKEDCDLLTKTNFTALHPLECGSKHLALYGTDGYSDNTHWCYITLNHYYEY